MRTLKSIAHQPTNTQTGGLRRGDWTTKLAHKIDKNEFKLIKSDETATTINIEGEEFSIEHSVLLCSAFYPAIKGEILYREHAGLLSRGYLNQRQRSCAETIKSTGIEYNNELQPVKSVLTAAQYKNNCISLGLDSHNAAIVAELLDTSSNITDKTTKSELIILIDRFTNLFFNDDQKSTYKTMVENETREVKRFAGLTKLGFADIARSGDVIVANIGFAEAQTAVPKLSEHGFALVKSTPDMNNFTIQVAFTEIETETTEKLD